MAVSLFFAGLKRVGPTTASILSTVEPVVTVILAFLVFGELLGPLQLLGGAFVIAAVLVLGSYRPREAIATTPA
jgi:drug/metabolite transporter (DMT)-like permease